MKRFIAGLFLSVTLVAFGMSVVAPATAHAQTYNQAPGGYSNTGQLNNDPGGATVGKIDPYRECDWTEDLGTCALLVGIVYGLWFRISNVLAEISAYVSDYFLWVSVQSFFYRFGDMMVTGWQLVRDMVNIGFIVALLYVGFIFITGRGSPDKQTPKRLLIKIVLSALLVNFSLFGARLIIDLGNIPARAIYTQLALEEPDVTSSTPGKIEVSESFLEITNPQYVLYKTAEPAEQGFFWNMLIVFFMAGILNIALIFIFISMAILFISRTVGLMLMAILVPIAIVVDIIPFLKDIVKKIPGVGSMLSFQEWLAQYFKLSMTAPIYVFFLYLILKVSNLRGIVPIPEGGGLATTIFGAMLPTIIILVMIKFAGKFTKEMAGAFGTIISEGVTKAVGFVGGLALGGIAAGASRVGGMAGKAIQGRVADVAKLSDTERASRIAGARGGVIGRKLAELKYGEAGLAAQAKLGGKLLSGTYDARNIQAPGWLKTVANKTGIAEEVTRTGLGGKFGKGTTKTYETRDKERAEKATKIADDRKAIIEKTIDAVNQRKQNELKLHTTNPALGSEEKQKLEDKIKLLEKGDGVTIDPLTDIQPAKDRQDQAKKDVLAAKQAYELDKNNPAAYAALRNAEKALKKADDDLADLEFRKKNQTESSLETLDSEIKKLDGNITTAKDEVTNAKNKLSAAVRAKKPESELKIFRDDVSVAEEALKKAQDKKTDTEAIIKARKDKAEEYKKDIADKKYQTSDTEAVEDADKLKKLREKWSNESDPRKRDDLQVEIDNLDKYIKQTIKTKEESSKQALQTRIQALQTKLSGETDPREQEYLKLEISQATGLLQSQMSSLYATTMAQAMTDQVSLDKKIIGQAIDRDVVKNMQSVFGNIGEQMVGAVGGALVAGVVTAATGGVGIPLALGIATGGGIGFGGALGVNAIRNGRFSSAGFTETRAEQLANNFRRAGRI